MFCRSIDAKLLLLEEAVSRIMVVHAFFALSYAAIAAAILGNLFLRDVPRECCWNTTLALIGMGGVWIIIHFGIVCIGMGKELAVANSAIQEVCDNYGDAFSSHTHSIKAHYRQRHMTRGIFGTIPQASVSFTVRNT